MKRFRRFKLQILLYFSLFIFLLTLHLSVANAADSSVPRQKKQSTQDEQMTPLDELKKNLKKKASRDKIIAEIPKYSREELVSFGMDLSEIHAPAGTNPNVDVVHAWALAMERFFASERYKDEKFDPEAASQVFKSGEGFHEVVMAWYSLNQEYRLGSQIRRSFEKKLKSEFLLKLFSDEYRSVPDIRSALFLLGGEETLRSFNEEIDGGEPRPEETVKALLKNKIFTESELVMGFVEKITSDSKLTGINLENRKDRSYFQRRGFPLSLVFTDYLLEPEMKKEKKGATKSTKKIQTNEFIEVIRADRADKKKMMMFVEALEFLDWRQTNLGTTRNIMKVWRENVRTTLDSYNPHELLRVFKTMANYSLSESMEESETERLEVDAFVSNIGNMILRTIKQLDKIEFLDFVREAEKLGWFLRDYEPMDLRDFGSSVQNYFGERISEFNETERGKLTKLLTVVPEEPMPKETTKKKVKEKAKPEENFQKVAPAPEISESSLTAPELAEVSAMFLMGKSLPTTNVTTNAKQFYKAQNGGSKSDWKTSAQKYFDLSKATSLEQAVNHLLRVLETSLPEAGLSNTRLSDISKFLGKLGQLNLDGKETLVRLSGKLLTYKKSRSVAFSEVILESKTEEPREAQPQDSPTTLAEAPPAAKTDAAESEALPETPKTPQTPQTPETPKFLQSPRTPVFRSVSHSDGESDTDSESESESEMEASSLRSARSPISPSSSSSGELSVGSSPSFRSVATPSPFSPLPSAITQPRLPQELFSEAVEKEKDGDYRGAVENYVQYLKDEKDTTSENYRVAERNLGMLYWSRKPGVPADGVAAINLFEEASDHGDVLSSYRLWVIYKEPTKVTFDLGKAFDRLKRAASSPLSEETSEETRVMIVAAQRELGFMYRNGLVPGVSQQEMDKESNAWLSKAAANGDDLAKVSLASRAPREENKSQASVPAQVATQGVLFRPLNPGTVAIQCQAQDSVVPRMIKRNPQYIPPAQVSSFHEQQNFKVVQGRLQFRRNGHSHPARLQGQQRGGRQISGVHLPPQVVPHSLSVQPPEFIKLSR